MTDVTNHYETLSVPPTARPATIEKAWRRQTAKEGPGSPRLEALNEAAETLLDPVQRAAYDVRLAEARPATVGEDDTAPEETARRRRVVRLVSLVVLPILALGAVGLAILFSFQARERAAVDRAATEAQAVAESALPAVLSYDYRRLDADKAKAQAVLDDGMKKKFDQTYDLLAKNKDGSPGAAVQTRTVVTANTVGTAVMDAKTDEVTVLAFVNQTSAHGGQEPRVFSNRIRVVLVEKNGTWLISELDPR